MASEIRANKQTNRVGLGTVTYTDTGIIVSGIVTANSFKGDGSQLTGVTSVGGTTGVSFDDNVKIKVGTHEDIEIYNKGNLSIIANKATGDSSNNNSLHIHSFYDITQSSAFSQYFRVGNLVGQENTGGGDSALNLRSGGAVEAFFDGTKRFSTSGIGATVFGQLDTTSNVAVGSGVTLSPDGNVFTTGISTFTGAVGIGSTLSIGGDEDILIRHDPDMFGDIYNEISFNNGNVFIVNKDTTKKYMYIRSNDIQLRDWSGNEAYIHCKTNQGVDIFYDNTKRLETTNTGAKVTGDLEITGVLTYEDVTNVDSIGIITARAGVLVGSGITLSSDGDIFAVGVSTFVGNFNIRPSNGQQTPKISYDDSISDALIFQDNVQARFGQSSDLRIYHSGSHSFIDETGTGNLYIRNGTKNSIWCQTDGQVNLYHNDSKKFETAETGAVVTGILTATSNVNVGSGITLSSDGNVFATGVTTTSSLVTTGKGSFNSLGVGTTNPSAPLHI